MTKLYVITLAGLMALQPVSAAACNGLAFDSRDAPRLVRNAFRQASLVVDAEVTEPMDFKSRKGKLPAAKLKVLRVWKGTKYPLISVAYANSCNIGLETKGERVRLMLSGNDAFVAQQELNGWFGDSNAWNAALDKLLGSSFARSGAK